eukprot:6481663-Amphidinium_carterae.2
MAAGGPRRIYVRANTKHLSRFYLWCLAVAETLESPVRHLESDVYYKTLLGLPVPPRRTKLGRLPLLSTTPHQPIGSTNAK